MATEKADLQSLLSLYQAQRADCGTVFSNGANMVSFALGYVGLVTGLVFTASPRPPAMVLIGAVVPLWLLVVYQSLLAGVNAAHGFGCEQLERLIFEQVPGLRLSRHSWDRGRIKDSKSDNTASLTGSTLGEIIMDPRRSSCWRRCATYISYGGLLVTSVGFSVLMISMADDGIGPWWSLSVIQWSGAALLLVFFVVAAMNYLKNLNRTEITALEEKREEEEREEASSGSS